MGGAWDPSRHGWFRVGDSAEVNGSVVSDMKSMQLRKLFQARFVFRLCVLALTIVMCFTRPDSLGVLHGLTFFHEFSWLDFLWIAWIVDMVMQFVPVRGYLPLGSLKQFHRFCKPADGLRDKERAMAFLKSTGRDSLKVLGVWTLLVAGIGILRRTSVLGDRELLLVSAAFYVCDLICVLFWCPFRVWMLKNRCCTTCPIFNWDHVMMFSPLLFIRGFFPLSLFAVAGVVFVVWEVSFTLHPERFCEDTNTALQCHNCTDRLCGGRNCTARSEDGRAWPTPRVGLQPEVVDMEPDGSDH